MSDNICDNLDKAIGKQRLLLMAIYGMNTPAVGSNLCDEEMAGLTDCICETIDLIQQVINGYPYQS